MIVDKMSSASAAAIKKDKPFGAHFSTKLTGVNSKLTCALSARSAHACGDTANDDVIVIIVANN